MNNLQTTRSTTIYAGLFVLFLGCINSGCGKIESGNLLPSSSASSQSESSAGNISVRARRLKVEPTAQRFLGTVSGNEKVEETFEIVNLSSQQVTLAPDVDTSCGCSHAELSRTVIGPNQSSELTLYILAPSVDAHSQAITALVRVVDPPDEPPVKVALSFEVAMPWTVRPAELRLTGLPGTQREQAVTVFRHSDQMLKILDATSDVPDVQLRYNNRNQAAPDQGQVYVTMKLPAEAGTHRGKVHIQTSDETVPSQSVDVIYKVLPLYAVAPPRLLVTLGGSSDSSATQSLTISGRGEAFQLADVECDDPHVGISLDPSSRKSDASPKSLTVTFDGSNYDVGLHKAVLKISMDEADTQRNVEVPVLISKQ